MMRTGLVAGSDVRRRAKLLLSSLVVLPGLALSSGCTGHGPETEATGATAPRPVPVTVTPLERREVERTVDVVGTLKGWEEINLGAKKGGRVVRVLHDMGDQVKPGEKLIELETIDAQLTLTQAKSKYLADLARLGITQNQAEEALKRHGVTEELIMGDDATRMIERTPAIMQATSAVEKARNNLTRQRNLHQRGAGTLEELQNLETDYDAAKAARDNAVATARNIIATAIASKVSIDAATQALTDLTVVAPVPSKLPKEIDRSKLTYGITRRSVAEGQMLKDGEVVMDLVIESPLRLWTTVPERHVGEIKVGQEVRLNVASYPSKVFKGKVGRINPLVDPASRTFQVETWVSNDGNLLRPGSFAKASILTESHSKAMVVPIESVMKYAGVTKVFVIEGDKARSINVETRIEGPGWVEIVGEIPTDALVVTTGQSQLADGTAVTVRSPETPESAKNQAETKHAG
ncbi:MAG: efflux RND transporter periplasmic adaptor subunit [Isosphaeraceae bacterium]